MKDISTHGAQPNKCNRADNLKGIALVETVEGIFIDLSTSEGLKAFFHLETMLCHGPLVNRVIQEWAEEQLARSSLELLLYQATGSLNWMITDMKHHHDETNVCPGNYSPQLKEAIALFDRLKEYFDEAINLG